MMLSNERDKKSNKQEIINPNPNRVFLFSFACFWAAVIFKCFFETFLFSFFILLYFVSFSYLYCSWQNSKFQFLPSVFFHFIFPRSNLVSIHFSFLNCFLSWQTQSLRFVHFFQKFLSLLFLSLDFYQYFWFVFIYLFSRIEIFLSFFHDKIYLVYSYLYFLILLIFIPAQFFAIFLIFNPHQTLYSQSLLLSFFQSFIYFNLFFVILFLNSRFWAQLEL